MNGVYHGGAYLSGNPTSFTRISYRLQDVLTRGNYASRGFRVGV